MKQICNKPYQELYYGQKVLCCAAIPILRYGNNFFFILFVLRPYKEVIRGKFVIACFHMFVPETID